MNRRLLILPLIALTALLVGASSPSRQSAAQPADHGAGFAQKTGTLATTWGELPTYSFQPSQLLLSRKALRQLDKVTRLSGKATVDLLVDRDGSVREAVIVESSGDPAVVRVMQTSFAGAKFPTKIAPGDPAPCVFRQKIVLVSQARPYRRSVESYNYMEATREPTYGPVDFYPPMNYSYSTGSP